MEENILKWQNGWVRIEENLICGLAKWEEQIYSLQIYYYPIIAPTLKQGNSLIKMQESKIFTKTELQEMEIRKKGDKADKTGIFSSRVKPKIIELLECFSKRKELKKLIEVKDDKK